MKRSAASPLAAAQKWPVRPRLVFPLVGRFHAHNVLSFRDKRALKVSLDHSQTHGLLGHTFLRNGMILASTVNRTWQVFDPANYSLETYFVFSIQLIKYPDATEETMRPTLDIEFSAP